jgi:protocatechuate 3,4-dioxygenase beta subunit
MVFCLNRIPAVVIACVLAMSAAVVAQEKTATGGITGKVTVKNKGVAGIVVVASEQNPQRWAPATYSGTTDQTGTYRITNIPAATYGVRPIAPTFALEDERFSSSVVLSEGENVEDINFSLLPGGVITGKVTDADGKPLIEQHVELDPVEPTSDDGRWVGNLHTDDRGIYRAYGLRPGKYKVSVGQDESLPQGPGPSYRHTFYPSVTDVTKATVIEVTTGSEATNIDIVVGRPVSTFKISGRVLDAETGKPLPNIRYGTYQGSQNGSSSIVGRNFTNANGEFRLENVLPGKYVVFIVPGETGVRGDSVSFEVVDRDVNDLVINAGKAGSVSGVVVFEGDEGSGARIKPNDLFVNAWVENSKYYFGGNSSQPVNPDGSFRIGGLQKGRIRFAFASRSQNLQKPIDIVRVERDGIAQTSGLTLNDGEQVTGLRLVVKYLTGAIHGEIKVEGDEALPASRLSIWLTPIDMNRTWYQSSGDPSVRLDSRKHFEVQGLAAGTYEVNVAVYDPGRSNTNRIYKQQVTVADNAVSEVTITIKAKP